MLHKLEHARLKLNPTKCFLFKKKVLCLGQIVRADWLSIDPEKINAVQEWGEPMDLTDIRSFLGLCSYYQRFLLQFSSVAKALTKLTERGTGV